MFYLSSILFGIRKYLVANDAFEKEIYTASFITILMRARVIYRTEIHKSLFWHVAAETKDLISVMCFPEQNGQLVKLIKGWTYHRFI